MSTPIEYASFLIRLWYERHPEQPAPTADWHSEIEHIQSGRRWTFSTLNELLNFLRRQAEDPAVLELEQLLTQSATEATLQGLGGSAGANVPSQARF